MITKEYSNDQIEYNKNIQFDWKVFLKDWLTKVKKGPFD